MTKAETIASLLDQARDKDALSDGEADRLPNDDATRLVWVGGLRSYAVADNYVDHGMSK